MVDFRRIILPFIFSFDNLKYYNIIKEGKAVYLDSDSEFGPKFDGSRVVVNNKFFNNIN